MDIGHSRETLPKPYAAVASRINELAVNLFGREK